MSSTHLKFAINSETQKGDRTFVQPSILSSGISTVKLTSTWKKWSLWLIIEYKSPSSIQSPISKFHQPWCLGLSLSCISFHQPPGLCLSCLSSSLFPLPPTLLDSCANAWQEYRAFVYGHTFLHSWSGPMTLVKCTFVHCSGPAA